MQLTENFKTGWHGKFSKFKACVIFSNGNFPKQLPNLFQKSASVNPYNTRSEEQLHISKINTVKYGTRSLRYTAF